MTSVLSLLDLAFTMVAGVLWYVKPQLGPVPLAWLVCGRLARLLSMPRQGWRRTAFDRPLLVFLLSAGLGTWIAYDQPVAQAKLWMIVGGLALYDSLALVPDRVRLGRRSIAPLPLFLALLPSVIAAYFLLTNDWPQWMGKLKPLDPVMAWFASWQPQLPGHRLHPNVAGGLIAGLLPLQLAALYSWSGLGGPARHRSTSPAIWLRRLLSVTLAGTSLCALLMSESRGAWAAAGLAGAGWWLLGPGRSFMHRPVSRGKWPAWLTWTFAGLAVCAGAATLAVAWDSALAGRLDVLANSLALAKDYPFTGLGLGGFEMAFSSYVLLLHVGYAVHSHNIFLNVWIEQGLGGLLALAWLLWTAVASQRRRTGDGIGREGAIWRSAAWASLAIILLHGLVDDAFYGSRGVLLLFAPFAVLSRLALQPRLAVVPPRLALAGVPGGRVRRGLRFPLFGSLTVVCLLAGALLPSVRAAFQADLGAVAQTRAELTVYRWPEWPIQDALRRSPQVDLAPAIARYDVALALDPGNVTANRRLGQIELSRGQYEAALRHLMAAYRASPDQRATRQLLGESYAIAGDRARGAALWTGLDLSNGQLEARQWWYQHIGENERAAAIAQAARLTN